MQSCSNGTSLPISVPITNLAVFLTLLRIISRVSGIGSEAMTAARLFLTSGSISLPPWEGNSETDKQRNTYRGLTTVNWCQAPAECWTRGRLDHVVCECVSVCVSPCPWCPCWTLTQVMILTLEILQKFLFLLQSLFYVDQKQRNIFNKQNITRHHSNVWLLKVCHYVFSFLQRINYRHFSNITLI